MPLQVPAIVENADHVACALTFAAAVDDEVPRVTHHSEPGFGAITTEWQVINPNAFGEIRPLLGTWTLPIRADVDEGLLQK